LKLSLLHILIISALLLIINSGKWGVIETSEARYAEISREMMENKDYVHPKLMEIKHYHKPPVTYYVTVLGFKIFGVNAFGARFFLQIAILIQLFLIYQITFLLFNDKKISLAAALIYFSLPLVLISSRNLTTDAYLNTFVLTSIYLWLLYRKKSKLILIYLFYIALGIIFEIKGPVGLLFPLLFIGILKIIFKEKIKKNWHHLFGILLFLIIATYWFIDLIITDPYFYDYFVHYQLKERIVSNSFNRSKPIWYYLSTIPLVCLPWFIILMVQLKKDFSNIIKERKIELVLYSTIITVFILFSVFKTKLVFYVLPMFGFIAVLSGKIVSSASGKSLKVYNKILISLGILFLLSILIMNVLDLGYQINTAYAVTITISAIVVCFIILKFQSGYIKTASLSFLFGCLLLLGGNGVLIENESQLNSTKPAVDFIENDLKDIKNILIYNYLMPSVKFNSNKTVITLNDGHNTVQRETQFETNLKWQDHLLDLSTEIGKQRTVSILQNQAVLISRKNKNLPDYLDFLEHSPYHKKEFGQWVIYYQN